MRDMHKEVLGFGNAAYLLLQILKSWHFNLRVIGPAANLPRQCVSGVGGRAYTCT